MEAGQVLGVHFDDEDDKNGKIWYELDNEVATVQENGTPISLNALSRVTYVNLRDSNLPVGSVVTEVLDANRLPSITAIVENTTCRYILVYNIFQTLNLLLYKS